LIVHTYLYKVQDKSPILGIQKLAGQLGEADDAEFSTTADNMPSSDIAEVAAQFDSIEDTIAAFSKFSCLRLPRLALGSLSHSAHSAFSN